MKQQNPPLRKAEEMGYTLFSPGDFPYLTLNEGAIQIGVSPQRLSRLLRILEVPVHRRGYVIFLDHGAINRVQGAIKRREVKPGRKKGTELPGR